MLAGGLAETAFALEAIVQELFFIIGPLLVALIVAIASAQAALGVAAVLVAVGHARVRGDAAVAAMAARRRGDRHERRRARVARDPDDRPDERRRRHDVRLARGGAARPSPSEHGSAGTAGVMLGTLAFGSLLGGFWYGAREMVARPGRAAAAVRLAARGRARVARARGLGPGDDRRCCFVAGLFIAPSAAASFSLVGRLAPPGAVTEAFTWLSTGVTAGFALGGVVAGRAGRARERRRGAAHDRRHARCCAAVVLYARRATLRVAAA